MKYSTGSPPRPRADDRREGARRHERTNDDVICFRTHLCSARDDDDDEDRDERRAMTRVHA